MLFSYSGLNINKIMYDVLAMPPRGSVTTSK